MRVLLVHNHYQHSGGEDSVFADEAELLEAHGHEVIRYTLHNDAIHGMNRLRVAYRTLWNRDVYADLATLIRDRRPDVMHCTNTFPLISPAAYYAAGAAGVPVVQSLHNYRLLCANSLFLRDGKPCEQCLGRRVGWPGIVHGCYRDSRAGSAVIAALQSTHWAMGTWQRAVSLYVVLTEFARQKFIAGGLPAERLAVKPNFVSPDPGIGDGQGGHAIFVGRLSGEKGIDTLLAAWQKPVGGLKLKIVGDGPNSDLVRAAVESHPHIEWLGRQPREAIANLVAQAAVLVLPSTCYEGLPKTILEAFASGTPVVGSRLGGIAESVSHGETGRLFTAGDAADLVAQVELLMADPSKLAAMRGAAREEFENKYTAQKNYELLMSLYERVGAIEKTEEVGAGHVLN